MSAATNEEVQSSKLFTVKDMTFTALFAVLIAICSWISIPTGVPFTLQTFGVFCAMGMLGGKKSFFAVLVYIILGAVGLPVFAGFSGGIGAILSSSGGYLVGFLFSTVVYWLIERVFGKSLPVMIIGMVVGLIVCYAFGTAWFMFVYARDTGAVGLVTALGWCVFPFIIPDLVKMALAITITKAVSRYVRL